MRRNLIRSCGLLVATGLACQLAWAGDRKTAARFREAQEQTVVTQKSHPTTSARFELTRPLLVTPFEGRNSVLTERRSGYLIEKSEPDTRSHEHKPLTLLHMNSRMGEITVEPVFGRVTGAQFSIGF